MVSGYRSCGLLLPLTLVALNCLVPVKQALGPNGWYGIPQTIYGCPKNWWTSLLEINFIGHNFRQRHRAPDVAGPIVGDTLMLGMCVAVGLEVGGEDGGMWPPGQYCVYRIGNDCPIGLESASLEISGANVKLNSVVDPSPLLPWQPSKGDVVGVGMCCRDDGKAGTPMELTLEPPFLLFRVGETCQEISGLSAQRQDLPLPSVTTTYRVSDVLTQAVIPAANMTVLPFCFYDVEDSCMQPSTTNATVECKSQKDIANTDTSEAGPGYPARQRTEPPYRQEALRALDDDPGTCATHHTLSTPWWQMDLRQAEQVTAFVIDNTALEVKDCLPQAATVYVSKKKDDFLSDSAPVCARNYTGSENQDIVVCKRPLTGHFVTILQGPGIKCLSICEFKAFIKESFCDIPLGVTDLSLTRNIMTSSNMANRKPSDLGIFSNTAWCAAPSDSQPYVQMDLSYSRMVTGLVTQGGEQPDSVFTVESLTMMYGTTTGELLTYTETANVPKVFLLGSDPHRPTDHALLRPVMARYIRLVVSSWRGLPCMRVQLVGCRDRQEPLRVKWVEDESGSVTDEGQTVTDVTDSVTDTCVDFNTSVGAARLSLIMEQNSVPQHLSVITHPYDDDQQALAKCTLAGNERQTGTGSTCTSEPEAESLVLNLHSEDKSGSGQAEGCPDGIQGKGCMTQLISFKPGTNVTVCEVYVYGYDKETKQSSSTIDLSCPARYYVRIVDVTSSVTSLPDTGGGGQLRVSRGTYSVLTLLCPTDSTACVLPAGTGSGRVDAGGLATSDVEDQWLGVQFACIQLTSPGTACHKEVTSPGAVMTTSDYLEQYGREFSCTWTVETSSGKYPKINIKEYQLVPSETMFYSGTFLVDPGSCRDQLWVQYVTDKAPADPWVPVDGPQTYLAPGSKVNLKLVTCLRVKVTHVDAPRLFVDYELTECPGCGVGISKEDMTYCYTPCGIVTSLGYPGGYKPNLSLTWRIRVAHRTYVSFSFTSFDVVSEDAGCKQDKVVVDDLDRTATRLINLGTYCNPKRPPETLYGDWENIQITFITDGEVTGKGFSAIYKTLKYFFPSDLEWIQNDTVCPVSWDSYDGSCYGFLETPDDVTWLEADDICQDHGARLVSVKNTREMIFINFLLIEYFNGADLYIGASDRIKEGRYIWHDGTPLTYTHWRKGRPDGATIEDCSALDLDSLRLKPSWVDIPCSSREANHFVCKKDREYTEISPLDLSGVKSSRAQCPPGTFRCGDGACVHGVQRCDGVSDCVDGLDEKLCGPPCPTYSFDCGEGMCRPLSAVCDGRHDCPDGLDERDCVFPSCSLTEFKCRSGPCIDARWHCDLNQNCHDGSDEEQCDLCSPELTFQCYDSSCLPASRRCDGTVDCPGGHKEDEAGCPSSASPSETRMMKCKNTQQAPRDLQCLYDTDRFGLLLGCRDANHLTDCADWECPDNYVKCPNSYCLAVHKVCDGTPDCPRAEDEIDCQNYTCPGMLRCRGYSNCVPRNRICDGVSQCHHGDDELFCSEMNDVCGSYYQCQCDTLVYSCIKARLKYIPWYILKEARKMNLTNNKIALTSKTFSDFHYLVELILVDNSIEAIKCCYFDKLVNLQLLDLAFNRLTDLFADAFMGLANLKRLVLTGNPIFSIEPGSFRGLIGMSRLSLYGLSIRKLKAGAFDGLKNVEDLDLSANTMQELADDAFRGLPILKRLNISRNVLSVYNGRDFKGLQHLEYLESDNQVFCCFVSLPEESCLPAPDAVSSCEDLLSRDVLRTFLWLLGVLSLVGNCAVLGYRCIRGQARLMASELLICHLAGADFLMGIYLIAMACADAYFRGQYVENATWWKSSWGCSILGMMASVSAEMSVITVFVITMDRLHRVKLPTSPHHLTARSASLLMALVWTLVVFLFLIPILPNSYFQSRFYSRSGVCVPIHITPDPAPGWQYSVFIFHIVNMTLFILMCVAYGSIYWTVRQMKGKKNRDLQRARKMASVVFVDFCCWVPINTMGMLSLAGVQVPGAMYAWTVVFILPINSSLNPVLYTLSTINFRGRGKKESNSSAADITTRWLGRHIHVRLTSTPEESKCRLTLDQFLHTQNEAMGDVNVLGRIFRQVAQLLDHLHNDRICLGEITMTNIEMDMDNSLRASFLSWPDVSRVADKAAVADDMAEYGQLMAHLLRAFLMRKARGAGPSQA